MLEKKYFERPMLYPWQRGKKADAVVLPLIAK